METKSLVGRRRDDITIHKGRKKVRKEKNARGVEMKKRVTGRKKEEIIKDLD